jgi:hypothetical protein
VASIYSIEVRPRGASKVVDGDGVLRREGARRGTRGFGDIMAVLVAMATVHARSKELV